MITKVITPFGEYSNICTAEADFPNKVDYNMDIEIYSTNKENNSQSNNNES